MSSLLGTSHPYQVVYYDPGLGTLNAGDQIISESARRYLEPLFEDCFSVNLSSHQATSFRYRRHLRESRETFVLGSNLLKAGMLFGFRQWDVSLLDTLQISKCVLVGCGWQTYQKNVDLYSKSLYRHLLSNERLHSVRDEYTKEKLASFGITNVINTGCATMWGLTPDYCRTIPEDQASDVVVTITDYRKDPEKDASMISQLLKIYDHVYIWPQGNGDETYINDLGFKDKCGLLAPTLAAYDAFLKCHTDVDYVGTRLHGGIRALQHGRRTMIIAIDNRAREMGANYGLPVHERDDMSSLTNIVAKPFTTDIRIDEDSINRFLGQFK